MKKLNNIEVNSLLSIKNDILKKIENDKQNNRIVLMDSLKLNTINKILKLWNY